MRRREGYRVLSVEQHCWGEIVQASSSRLSQQE
jgi:hypothetical protein